MPLIRDNMREIRYEVKSAVRDTRRYFKPNRRGLIDNVDLLGEALLDTLTGISFLAAAGMALSSNILTLFLIKELRVELVKATALGITSLTKGLIKLGTFPVALLALPVLAIIHATSKSKNHPKQYVNHAFLPTMQRAAKFTREVFMEQINSIKASFKPNKAGLISNLLLPARTVLMLGLGVAAFVATAAMLPFNLVSLFLVKETRNSFFRAAMLAPVLMFVALVQALAIPATVLAFPFLAIKSLFKKNPNRQADKQMQGEPAAPASASTKTMMHTLKSKSPTVESRLQTGSNVVTAEFVQPTATTPKVATSIHSLSKGGRKHVRFADQEQAAPTVKYAARAC